MSKQVTIENTRAGGIGLPTGQLVPGNGSISVEPEIWGASKDHPVVKAMVDEGALIIDGRGRKKPAAGERDENGDTEEMAEMRKRFDASFSVLQTELQTEKAKVAELEQTVSDRDAEIARLKRGSGDAPLKAAHRGGGSYSIMRGDEEIVDKLSKEDADSFNAMSDEDKRAYVEAHAGKAKG